MNAGWASSQVTAEVPSAAGVSSISLGGRCGHESSGPFGLLMLSFQQFQMVIEVIFFIVSYLFKLSAEKTKTCYYFLPDGEFSLVNDS